MRRSWLIIFGGLAVAVLAYCGTYYAGSSSSRCMAGSKTPELAWLQKEFQIPDAEFRRISEMHDAYLADCMERCRRIDAKTDELKTLLAATNQVTPAIEKGLQDAAQLRAECHKKMLEHFYAVSQAMPREQGQRYFSWVVSRTFGSEHSSMTLDPSAGHEHRAE
jgi:hypothetical protein